MRKENGAIKKCSSVLAGKPEGRRLLGKPVSRWEDNMKTRLKETGWEVVV
jgi:hypothetical protein